MFDAQQLHDALIKAHEAFYRADPSTELMTTFVVVDSEGVKVVGAPWHDDASRSDVLSVMRQVVQRPDVVAYAVCSEAWVSGSTEVRPSLSDDRKEIVFTLVVPRDGENIFSSMEIDRDWTDGSAILKPFEALYGDGGGALAELFDG